MSAAALDEVFPAHAGMVPKRARTSPRICRFSPPTRGWSCETAEVTLGRSVFPAHAGMVPQALSTLRSVSSFPRPRGDGPGLAITVCRMYAFSPPTRGWSLDGALRVGDDLVSPPTRGWSRTDHRHPRNTSRFPRPRGDGPVHPSPAQYVAAFSPPTRGWSAWYHASGRNAPVFPAHAGMVPRQLDPHT